MELDWSAQSPHIRTLFRPWQPGDGYDEATVHAAEERLGLLLPNPLRNFYLALGRRRDMTDVQDPLLDPDTLVVRAKTLIFCAENQAVWYWGVRCEALEEADPPVVVTESGLSGWQVESELNWKSSHSHLSYFLDDMTYLHALCGGAIHGGWTRPYLPDPSDEQIAWLEAHWSKARVSPMAFGMNHDPIIQTRLPLSDEEVFSPFGPLYIRDGQAFHPFGGYQLAARGVEAVREIAQRFQIAWAHRW